MVAHRAVIQTLSRNGIYVVEDGDIAVTDSALQQKKPFRKVSIRASFFSTAYNTVHSVKPQCNMTEHLTENHSTLSNLKMMCIWYESYICTADKEYKWSDLRSCEATKAVAKKVQKTFWGSNGIRTHDLHNTGAMLYQLSYEASPEAGQVRVQFIPII